MMNPLISVFVPTKNRYVFLKEFINLVEGFNDRRIELVVQDNSDDNSEILQFLEGRELISTKYYYSNAKLSMSENSNLAFSHCTGDYVCMMGDDDAVCRNIADCAEWMKANDIEAVRAAEVQFYYEGKKDDLLYYEPSLPTCRKMNPRKEMIKVLKAGIPDFGNMAKIYHGIVKRSVLTDFLKKDGHETIFPGCTPDMSGSIVATLMVKNLVKVNFPILLPGQSIESSGGMTGKIVALEEVPWITQETRDNWEQKIPRIWAREFIWPDSGSKAFRYCGCEHLLRKYMNYYLPRCRYIVRYKQHREEVKKTSPSKLKLALTMIRFFCTVGVRFFFYRQVVARFNHKIAGRYNYTHDCHSMAESEEFLYRKGLYYDFNKLNY